MTNNSMPPSLLTSEPEPAFPPPGFIPAPSKVTSIEVYIPGDTTPKRADILDFKCPKCGATIAYSVEHSRLRCEYCGYSEEVEEKRLGRAAEQFEFRVDTLERSEKGWGDDRKELLCQRCGGVVSVPPDALAFSCPFCGSNKVLFREPLEDVLRPRFMIPFKVDPRACEAITKQWLGSSWMTPRDLRSIPIEKFNPIYIPYWTFGAACFATWKAEVAHDVVDVFYENGQRREVRRVVWRTELGKVQRDFTNLLVPASTRLTMRVLGRVDNFDINDLILYEPRHLAGMQAQAYDLPLEQAWDVGRQLMRETTRKTCLDRASDTRVRGFNMALDFRDEQWRYILTPMYTSVYNYAGEVYQILVNGQNGKIAGPRPVDWGKVWIVLGSLLAPGFILALFGLLFSANEPFDKIAGVGLLLFFIGLIVDFFIFRQAQEMEDV